jgi:hypothetical protein
MFTLNMIFGSRTIFGRACGASSKSNFSSLLFKAPYAQNKPFFFQGSKNHSEATYRDSRGIRGAIEGILTPPPPNFSTKSFNTFHTLPSRWRTSARWLFGNSQNFHPFNNRRTQMRTHSITYKGEKSFTPTLTAILAFAIVFSAYGNDGDYSSGSEL